MPERNKKVLIIDDEKLMFLLFELDIESAGMQAINPGPVKSVENALEIIKKYGAGADFILLDMNYGYSNGFHKNESSDGFQVAKKLSREMLEKVICTSSLPEDYKNILQPLGVKHFGGKKKFTNCLLGTCDCETVD